MSAEVYLPTVELTEEQKKLASKLQTTSGAIWVVVFLTWIVLLVWGASRGVFEQGYAWATLGTFVLVVLVWYFARDIAKQLKPAREQAYVAI